MVCFAVASVAWGFGYFGDLVSVSEGGVVAGLERSRVRPKGW